MTTPEGVPNPFVPAEVDLRDFPFLPLDCVRFRDSGLVAEADPASAFFGVVLWCVAWHQVPAATLPGDDRALAKLAGFGRDLTGWQAVKADALRGFVACADGRLHHPVIAEKALEAWLGKLTKRLRGGKGNARRWGYAFDPDALTTQIARAELALKFVRDRTGGPDWLDDAPPAPAAGDPAGTDDDGPGLYGGMFEGTGPYAIPMRSNGDPSAIAQGSQEKRREEIEERGETRAGARTHARDHTKERGQGMVPAGPSFAAPVLSADASAAREHALVLADEHAPPVASADPEAWGAFLAMLEAGGGLNGPRLLSAGGQLRAHAHAGRDVSAILRAAVARGFRDLSDARLIASAPGAPPAASKTRTAIERALTPRDER